MADRKVRVTLPNIGTVEGSEVQVVESTERWTDVKLDDGTSVRIKPVVMSVIRVDGRYDPQGNPMYAVQAGQAMSVSAPEHLRKQPDGSKVP
jgi:hypothetical protein